MILSIEQEKIIRQFLKNFSFSEESNICIYQNKIKIDRSILPLPQLVYFLLTNILGFISGYRHEKMHWVIYFAYKNAVCAVSSEKFGMYLYVKDKELSHEIFNDLKKSITYLEKKVLHDIAKAEMEKGNLTISNHFNQLTQMYYHFRNEAQNTFIEEVSSISPNIDNLSANMMEIMKKMNLGFYNTFSMVEAYFSRFEHFLVYCLFFNSNKKNNVYEFCKKDWTKKFKFVFSCEDTEVNQHYIKILDIKEKYRNTFSHGMFSKNGEPFFFEIENIGILPANLSNYKNSPHFKFFPIDQIDFEEICKTFDDIDEWLMKKSAFAWIYASSSLNLSFTTEFFNRYRNNNTSVEQFKAWLRLESMYQEMILNADY